MKLNIPVTKTLLSVGLLASTIESLSPSRRDSVRYLKYDSIEDDDRYFSMGYSHSYSYNQKTKNPTKETKVPKKSPTRSPKSDPTFTPIINPTSEPSLYPTPEPTTAIAADSQPTDVFKNIKCEPGLDDVGSIGTLETPITFYYHVQTNGDFISGSSDWIKALEDLLLQALGENLLTCDKDKLFYFSNDGNERLLQDNLEIISVNSSPKDQATGDTCKVTNTEATSCIGMRGGFTITHTGDIDEGKEAALTYVQDYMEKSLSAEKLGVTGIVQIDYVGEENAVTKVRGSKVSEENSSSGLDLLIGSICIATAIIALIGLRYIRKSVRGEFENLDDVKEADDCTLNSEKDEKSFDDEESDIRCIPKSAVEI